MFKELQYIILILILIVNAMLVLAPAFSFNLPIVQTDGATHYVYAKVYSETLSLDSKNPEYNKIGSAEEKISDYPPFTTIIFGGIIRIFGNDIFWINGGLSVIFFLLASIFFYMLLRDLTKNKSIALIGLVFFVLNVRAYYTLLTGTYPAFISFCLSIPALYFSYKLFSGRIQNLAFAIIFTFLTTLTYTIQGLYLIFLEFMLWLGMEIAKNIDIKFPKIDLKINLSSSGIKKVASLIIPSLVFFVIIFLRFSLEARSPWISEWISNLLSTCPGYPCIWKYFFIVDNPLIVLFAVIGIFYLIYKKNWMLVSLFLGGVMIVLSGGLFSGSGIIYFIYRFYTTFFVLLLIPASILLNRIITKNRKLGIFLLIIALIIQISIVGFFYSKIGSAISQEEYAASKELLKYSNSSILYVNNDNEVGSFKAFKWIVVFAESENYNLTKMVPEELKGYDYIFVENKENLSSEEEKSLSNCETIFDGKMVEICKTQ